MVAGGLLGIRRYLFPYLGLSPCSYYNLTQFWAQSLVQVHVDPKRSRPRKGQDLACAAATDLALLQDQIHPAPPTPVLLPCLAPIHIGAMEQEHQVNSLCCGLNPSHIAEFQVGHFTQYVVEASQLNLISLCIKRLQSPCH